MDPFFSFLILSSRIFFNEVEFVRMFGSPCGVSMRASGDMTELCAFRSDKGSLVENAIVVILITSLTTRLIASCSSMTYIRGPI